MSSVSITIPRDFPLVGLSLASLALFDTWQKIQVGIARKKYKVYFPNLYATDAEARADNDKFLFNCVQRSHQNTLETVPLIIGMTLFFGLYHPRLAATFTHTWIVGRYGHARGYATGDPEKRVNALSRLYELGITALFLGTLTVGILNVKESFF